MKVFLFLAVFTGIAAMLFVQGQLNMVQHTSSMGKMIAVIDSLGRRVVIPHPLEQVVVVNPYNAELIAAVGASDTIRGIDRDIYENRDAFTVPMTKEMIVSQHGESGINYEKIIQIKPQAVILDGGLHYKQAEQILGMFGIKVLVIRADSSSQFFDTCRLIGTVFGKEPQADALSQYFQKQVDYINDQLKGVPHKKVYYECRRFGRAVIPGEAFNEMLTAAHADNIFNDANSTHVDKESIILRKPEYIIRLSDINESYSYYPPDRSFFEQIKENIKNRSCWGYIPAVQNDRIFLYSYYSHGGAGKLMGAMYLAKYLYPEYLPNLHPEDVFWTWLTQYEKISYKMGHTYPVFGLSNEVK